MRWKASWLKGSECRAQGLGNTVESMCACRASSLLAGNDGVLTHLHARTHVRGTYVCMACMHACMHSCMHAWMDGWVGGWVGGWMDGWMDV